MNGWRHTWKPAAPRATDHVPHKPTIFTEPMKLNFAFINPYSSPKFAF